ncbi:MAG: hypothetical protein GY774_16350 [Planctomycetes bacterium]|nr:hypothetical protein [Planctomycetota bacterium]
MDKDKLNHIDAEVFALKIMVTSLTLLVPDKNKLQEYITKNADLCVSMLPAKTKEQKKHIEMVKNKLNHFYELFREHP